MWFCVSLFIPVSLFAQNEATQGKWEWLYHGDSVVVWRSQDEPARQRDQLIEGYAPPDAWRTLYGIHAALLPVSGETGNLQRGWVILWGGGRERSDFLVPAHEAEPYYFRHLQGYQVPRLGITQVLLWHPEDTDATQPAPYGYVRYLFDTHAWNDPGDYPPYRLFCSGHVLLPDGRLFLAGGHGGLYGTVDNCAGSYIGLRLLSIFEAPHFRRENVDRAQHLWWTYFPSAEQREQERRENRGYAPEPRWYPSLVALPDGKVLIVGGTWFGFKSVEGQPECPRRPKPTEYHEIFDPCTNTVAQSRHEIRAEYSDLRGNYPRLHLVSFMQDGQLRSRVVSTGPGTSTYYLENPSNIESEWDVYPAPREVRRDSGTSVLLPNPVLNPRRWQDQVLSRVLTIGGSGDSNHLSFDLNDFSNGGLTIQRGVLRDYRPRVHINAVLLPTGQVLVVGGRRPGSWIYPRDVVFETLLYTPPSDGTSLGSWEVVAPAPSDDRDGDGIMDGTRVYHSVALLLPDGRVLTAGSGTEDSSGFRFSNRVPTFYLPPYLFKSDGTLRGEADRPRIVQVSRTKLNYGEQFTVEYQLASDGAGIQSVVLMRPGSVTHSVNFEQRLVRLHYLLTVPDSGQAVVVAPWHPSIAPPGWYMLFLVDANGVPSKAAWVRLQYPCTIVASSVELRLEGIDQLSPEQAEAIENEPITLEFRNPATGATLQTYTLPMVRPDGQGQVVLEVWSDLPAGLYEVYVHPYRSWLGQRALVNWRPGGRLVIPLRNGDVVKDNQVDYADLVAVLEMQGATGVSAADVNADGVVNEADVAIVATNVGQQGDE